MSTGEQPQLKPHRSGFVYTFGILSFISGFFALVFGPIAWISGRRDLKEMDAGVMDNSGRGLTQAGQVLGMIMTIFWTLVVILGLTAFSFIMNIMSPSSHGYGEHTVEVYGEYEVEAADVDWFDSADMDDDGGH